MKILGSVVKIIYYLNVSTYFKIKEFKQNKLDLKKNKTWNFPLLIL